MKEVFYNIVAAKMLVWCVRAGVDKITFYMQFKSIVDRLYAQVNDKQFKFAFFAQKVARGTGFLSQITNKVVIADLYPPIRSALKTSLKDGGDFEMFKHIFKCLGKRLNMINVEVCTAVPLPHKEQEVVIKSITKLSNNRAIVVFTVDEKLISGWKILYGNKEIDFSLSGKVDRMMEELVLLKQ